MGARATISTPRAQLFYFQAGTRNEYSGYFDVERNKIDDELGLADEKWARSKYDDGRQTDEGIAVLEHRRRFAPRRSATVTQRFASCISVSRRHTRVSLTPHSGREWLI